MAYVPGYDHDVFVSYAHAAEAADSSGKWATEFIDRLRGALKHRLRGSEELRIFFDRESLGSNQQLEEMLTAARRSAIFLAIAWIPFYSQGCSMCPRGVAFRSWLLSSRKQ